MSQIAPRLLDKIKYAARFPQTGVPLKQMVMFGQKPSQATLFKASQFLHEELPIRLAHRVKELDGLPPDLSKMPSIMKIKEWYAQSFQDLTELPPAPISKELKDQLDSQIILEQLPESRPNPSLRNFIKPVQGLSSISDHRYYNNIGPFECSADMVKYTETFTKAIEVVKKRHDPVVTTMAQGILEYKEYLNSPLIDSQMQRFLDRFYMSRIGIRMLIGQHLALYRGRMAKDYVGVICKRTKIQDVAMEAIQSSRTVCNEHYGLFSGPEIHLYCPGDMEFTYVPSHLNHILFELLKNSLRAVVEKYGIDYEDQYPPIKLIIAHGKEDITIKISDEGGGIPRSETPLVWTYMYTTAKAQEYEIDQSEFRAPMAGFGYGLPISRLYAQYFGGDLKLTSMEGYGTDVYLHLNRTANSEEPLIYDDEFTLQEEPQLEKIEAVSS